MELRQKIKTAYRILSDPTKKKIYDHFGDSFFSFNPKAIEKIAESFMFHSSKDTYSSFKKGKAVLQPLTMSLKDIYYGKEVSVKVTRDRACTNC